MSLYGLFGSICIPLVSQKRSGKQSHWGILSGGGEGRDLMTKTERRAAAEFLTDNVDEELNFWN